MWYEGKWGEWESLGGGTEHPIAAVSWSKNRLDLLVRGTDDAVFTQWWDGSAWRP